MKTPFPVIIFFLTAFIIDPGHALAARQYRCNGFVQYRPCNQPVPNGKGRGGFSEMVKTQHNAVRATREMRAELKLNDGSHYGKIVKQSYTRVSNISGHWRGVVEGNGTLRLMLQILRNGKIESSRFMGEVALRNKQTRFSFISAPPRGSDWSWKILVFAS